MTAYPDDSDLVREGVPWWVILLTGIAALILGLLVVTSPGETILVLVQFLGVYWFVGGIFSIVEIFFNSRNWGWKLVLGFLGILAGLTILRHPITSGVLVPALIVLFVAIEGIIIGIVSFFRAFRERSLGLGILGLLSVLLGLGILAEPLITVQILSILIGIMAIIGGVAAIIVSFRARGEERRPALSQQSYQQVPVTGPDETPDSKNE